MISCQIYKPSILVFGILDEFDGCFLMLCFDLPIYPISVPHTHGTLCK